MHLLQEIAFHAHCKQMKDLNGEVLRSAITEQTSALWDDVKESVARGQFAVLTFFVENDETIYRFGHLTFQEHLCSMVINRMLGTELDRVKNIMTASGGIRKMLQGSWWLTVTQFCLEGLMAEGLKLCSGLEDVIVKPMQEPEEPDDDDCPPELVDDDEQEVTEQDQKSELVEALNSVGEELEDDYADEDWSEKIEDYVDEHDERDEADIDEGEEEEIEEVTTEKKEDSEDGILFLSAIQ